MLLLYCLFDFRLVHLDLRFFCILFLGILYSFQLARLGAPSPGAPSTSSRFSRTDSRAQVDS